MEKLNASHVLAFHVNRNTPFTWEHGWVYVVNRVMGCKPLQVRRFIDAQFIPIKTGEDFLDFGLLFNNPDLIGQAMKDENFSSTLNRYFDGCSISVINFQDHHKNEAQSFKYYMAFRLTFK